MGSSLYLLRVKSAVADSGITIAVGLLLMCILSAVIVSTGVITPVSNYSPTVLLSDDATESPSETEHLITQANDVDARVSHSTAAYTSGQQLRNEHAYPLGAVDNVTVIGSSKGKQLQSRNRTGSRIPGHTPWRKFSILVRHNSSR